MLESFRQTSAAPELAHTGSEAQRGLRESPPTELAFFQQIQQIGAYLFRIHPMRARMVIPGKTFHRVDITSNRLNSCGVATLSYSDDGL